jgi:hypothetical protein
MKLPRNLAEKVMTLADATSKPTRKTASLTKRPGDKVKSKLALDLSLWAKASGLPDPIPEHKFHPVRKWRFDHAWPALLIAVEYEGLGGGRHQRAVGYSQDCFKYNTATAMGWVVFRVTALNAAQVVQWLDEALELRRKGN